MFGSVIVEVAIGLVVIFVLFSLVGSTITEGIAQTLNLRGKNLVDGIEKLFHKSGQDDLVTDFLNHPLIQGLDQNYKKRIKKACPDYISSETFKTVLSDLLKLPHKVSETGAELEAVLKELPEGNLKVSLQALFQSAKGEVAEFEHKLSTWYDEAMSRVSALYKRKAHVISFLTALGLVLVFNVDTLDFSKSLYKNSNLRQSLVSVANQNVERSNNDQGADSEQVAPMPQLDDMIKEVREAGLALGWSEIEFANTISGFDAFLIKILGLAISTFAISLGAPFWFQLLNKLVNLRSSGTIPLTAEESKILEKLKND